MSKLCEHNNFTCNAQVNRLTNTDNGPVTGYMADIKISCTDCGIPFGWVGLDRGVSNYKTMVSFDGLELRAPLVPAAEQ
jgi:hypothetical protein